MGSNGKKKRNKNGWATKGVSGAADATAMMMWFACETGRPLEEVAASMARLEECGFLRREPDGSVILLNPETRQ